ncbi:MAG: HAD-IC family P-type ATPase, partial [Agriterribacter sp.]
LVVLVIATVPVAMPASFTVANAVEARVLAKEGVLVTGLTAIQEAATMQVLCIDKTGTLTQNKPIIASIFSLSGNSENELLAYAASACDASSQNPIDIAILQELKKRSLDPFVREQYNPFNPIKKCSEAYIRQNGQVQKIILGSPFVMEAYAASAPLFKDKVAEMAANGGRVLAVAVGAEGNITVRGLLTLADLPRDDAATLVQAIKDLGIRLLMVTGDTPATAKVIARKLNLGERIDNLSAALQAPLNYDGIANVYPEEKYQIIQALQKLNLTVGMTGDGINDAPALKQAEVGIAVSSATDVAKASAKVVLTNPGLQDIVKIIHGGRRVYRRMMTWTITKITRTIELAVLLTIGYIATGDFVVPLSLIVLIVVFNDLVTITLGTDRAWVSPTLEQWDVKSISKLSGILAAGWLALAFVILWVTLKVLKFPFPQIQTLMFLYLIYSAQATIYITRVREHFWSFLPSRLVIVVTLGNIVVSSILALNGILMKAVTPVSVFGVLTLVIVAGFLLDAVKIRFYKRNAVGG